jgi:hypothetical protein
VPHVPLVGIGDGWREAALRAEEPALAKDRGTVARSSWVPGLGMPPPHIRSYRPIRQDATPAGVRATDAKECTMKNGSSNERFGSGTWVLAWVLVSSIIWAAVVISTGNVGWPLVVWALTTFAPVVEQRRRQVAAHRMDT